MSTRREPDGEAPPSPDNLESVENMLMHLRRQEWWRESFVNTGMFTLTDAQRITLRRFRKAVEVLRYHLNLAVAAYHRTKVLEDEKLLASIAAAQGETRHPMQFPAEVGGGRRHGTSKQIETWRDRATEKSLETLDALPDPTPGITAQEAARQFGYSRQGARERLERGAEAGLLEKRNELRAGKWVVVYTPTEKATAYMQHQKALPDGKAPQTKEADR